MNCSIHQEDALLRRLRVGEAATDLVRDVERAVVFGSEALALAEPRRPRLGAVSVDAIVSRSGNSWSSADSSVSSVLDERRRRV